MDQEITPEMGDLIVAVYEGGEDAGMQLTGRSDWGEFKDTLAGSQRDPLEPWEPSDPSGTKIGMSGEMTIPVGADGQIVNQARHRRPGEVSSTHLLKVYVAPTVTFGVDGNVPIIRWIANVSVIELTKNRIVLAESSSDDEAERALAGKRPVHVYMNDSDYKAALPGFLHETPREAVRVALQKISAGGLIDLPDRPDPATSAPIAATTKSLADSPERPSGRPTWLLPLLGAVGIAVVIIALLAFSGGGKPEADQATTVSGDGESESVIAAPPGAEELEDDEAGELAEDNEDPETDEAGKDEPAATDPLRQIQIGGPVFGDSDPSTVDTIGVSVNDDGSLVFTFPAEAITGQRYVAIEALGATSDDQDWFTECGFRPEESKFLCLTYDNHVASQYYGQKELTLAELTNPDGSLQVPSVFQLVNGAIVVKNYDDGNCSFCVGDRGDVTIRDVWFGAISTDENYTTGQVDDGELLSLP